MSYRSDYSIRGADGRTLALIEIKNREELTPEVATAIRRNLMSHGLTPVRYFLLLSQDDGYIWKSSAARQAAPTAHVAMEPVVSRYLPNGDLRDRLRGVQLELIVGKWLDDLTGGNLGKLTDAEQRLATLGFVGDVRGGSVLAESIV